MFNDSKARMVLNDGREINLTKNTGLSYQNVLNPSTCNESKQTIKGDINLWHKQPWHHYKTDMKRTVG